MGNTTGTPKPPMTPVKKVIIFGKTGSGKSTIANMLVEGTPNGYFRTSNGLRGETQRCSTKSGRGYEVTDTVGLGEPNDGTVNDKRAEAILKKFLDRVRGEYSHIIFVKQKGRLDYLDQALWESFTKIFEGAERAFMIVISKADNGKKWVNEQKVALKESFVPYEGKFVPVDFFPSYTDNGLNPRLAAEIRGKSLENLDNELEKSFLKNGYTYFKPDYCGGTNDIQRAQKEAIVQSVRDIAKKFKIDFANLVIKLIGFGTAVMNLVSVAMEE